MRCETSFFSGTIYKKLLTRYWPIWAVWLLGWFIAVPVAFWNRAQSCVALGQWELLAELAERPAGLGAATSVMACFAAIIVAAAVFFYLFNIRATVLLGSLPLRREGLFATAFLAGLTMLVAPLVAVALIDLLVEATVGAVNVLALLRWLGGSFLGCFFAMSFATLCCVISGNMVAAVAFYGIFNGVVMVMSTLVEALCKLFFFGYAGMERWMRDAAAWCTPVWGYVQAELTETWAERAWIYAGVGFLMLLAALVLHHIRRSERAGDLIAFKPLRYAFKVCVILCGGIALGMAFTVFFFGGFNELVIGTPLTVCCCAAAVICAFVADMLLKKSFRVWKTSWRWALVSVCAFAVVLSALNLDVIGFAGRVPEADRVARAELQVHGSGLDSLAGDGLFYEGEDVAAVIRLHRAIVDTRGEDYETDDPEGGQMRWRSMEICYTLKNGWTMRREYGCDMAEGGRLDRATIDAVLAGRAAFDLDRPVPDGVEVYWSYMDSGSSAIFRGEEAAQLWAAIREDVEAGRYRSQPHTDEVQWPQVMVSAGWVTSPFGGMEWTPFYCSPDTTSVNAVVARLSKDAGAWGDAQLSPGAAEREPET